MKPGRCPLVLPALLLVLLPAPARAYTLRGSVSWAVSSNDVVVEDADLSEEAAPALLVDGAGLWKQAYPSPEVLEDGVESPGELVGKPEADGVARLSSRLFSYRLEKVKKSAGGAAPPPHQETARTARYISHYSDWGHLATISTLDKIKGLPFGNIFSVSDGPLDNSTGVIYFYVTPMDNTVSDLRKNPYASLTFSEAEGEFCRHPVMAKWPVGHKWFFMKLDLVQVWLQDWFGGVSFIPLEDYFRATPF